jgi:hypothetical protein
LPENLKFYLFKGPNLKTSKVILLFSNIRDGIFLRNVYILTAIQYVSRYDITKYDFNLINHNYIISIMYYK